MLAVQITRLSGKLRVVHTLTQKAVMVAEKLPKEMVTDLHDFSSQKQRKYPDE